MCSSKRMHGLHTLKAAFANLHYFGILLLTRGVGILSACVQKTLKQCMSVAIQSL